MDPRNARVHEEGWQSWSPSGAYALRDRPHRPAGADRAAVCHRPGTTVPAGAFQGEGLLALDPGDGSPVRLWAAADPLLEVPSIRLVKGLGDVVEVTADGPVKEWTGTDFPSLLGSWATSLAVPAPRPAPTVWSSRYAYAGECTEEDVHENLRAMDTLDLPIDVVQLDDVPRRAPGGSGFRSRCGEGLAATIRARGRRAGIRTAPFLVDPASEPAVAHPEMLLRTRDGGPVHAGPGLRVLDTTHPAAAAHLTTVFRALRAEGHDHFTLDLLHAGALDGVRHDDMDALTAYRAGVRLIREAIGAESYLLGCGAPLLPSIGLFDAMRVSPGTAPHRRPEADDFSRPGQAAAEFTGASRQWQHGRLWTNDPDCLLARPGVETRERWAAHVGSTGGVRASGDRLLSLDPWGVETTRGLLDGAGD
ncbi:alpha-galactosidase [Streptomyces sp. NPDC090106]|uniref:alpha-galactosidase n=1 Tax=Streptomyces sp. NPDC090106 TaxID=3365946 RepID=UPI00381BDB3C